MRRDNTDGPVATVSSAVQIELALIRTDPDLQMWSNGIDIRIVAEYAAAMVEGAIFPPIVMFFDGNAYWPGDGFHRIEATKRNNVSNILADVRRGTRRHAVLYAAGVNASHGLQRTQADMRLTLSLEQRGWEERSAVARERA